VRTLLIDANGASRAELRTLLAAHPEIRISGEAESFAAAQRLLTTAEYDLVFLDLDLTEGCGFELLVGVRTGARAILVASHERGAFRAVEANAVDYLLKPVRAQRLAAGLARIGAPPPVPPTQRLLGPASVVQLVSGHTSRFVALAEISLIASDENYSRVHLTDATRVMVRRSLKGWEAILPANFTRVHRTALVNLDQVTECARTSRCVTLQLVGVQVPVTASRGAARKIRVQLHGRFPEV
jgi:two-component system, LytTR family, response regulator